MQLTTRTKITLLFTLIVTAIIAVLNIFVFEAADREWQTKQYSYVEEVMNAMYSPEEAKEYFTDLEILSSTGVSVFRQ